MYTRRIKFMKRQDETWPRVTVSKRNRDNRACHDIGVLSQLRRAKISSWREHKLRGKENRFLSFRIANSEWTSAFLTARREKIGPNASRNWRASRAHLSTVYPSIGAIVFIHVYGSTNTSKLQLNFSPRIDN